MACAGAALLLVSRETPGAPAEECVIEIGEPQGTLQPLCGVNAGPQVLTREGEWVDFTEPFRRVGVAQIRTHDFYGPLDMAVLYPDPRRDPHSPGALEFGLSDRAMRSILDGGFEPYLRLGDSWQIGHGGAPLKRRIPADRTRWIRAAVEIVRHYRQMCGPKLRYIEIWNEPDLRQFWDAPVEEFFPFFDETVRAIKSEAPELKVGGPGWTMAGWMAPKGRAALAAFLDDLARRRTPWDFFSWHLYSNDPKDFVEAARYFRAELDRRGWKKIESHVTEYNTDERRVPAGMTVAQVRAGAAGAALLTAGWIGLQQTGVQAAFFYRGADPAMDERPRAYGLFHMSDRRKKASYAFEMWAQMAACRERLEVAATGAGANALWLLAGRDADGAVRLLIANPTPNEIAWRLRLPAASQTRRLVIQEINDVQPMPVRLTPPEPAARTPAYTTQMVVLAPLTDAGK